jgi:glutathione S-transferase
MRSALNSKFYRSLDVYIKYGDKYKYESVAHYIYLAHKTNRADLLGSTLSE